MSRCQWTLGVLTIGVVVALAAVLYVQTQRRGTDTPAAVVSAQFVGSARCSTCHAAEARAWQGSQHQRAMQPADESTVLGNFADATFTHAGVTTSFRKQDGKFIVRTDGPDGTLADFEVRYTFGVYPLQQYLLALPRGRLQALSIAWDARPVAEGGQRWFHLYPDERIDHSHELHWTGRQQNWNFMCADCHSTGLDKKYDAARDAYATTFAEISVGCEACHGPGSRHVAWSQHRRGDPTRGLTVQLDERRAVVWQRDPADGQPQRSVARESQREVEVCAQCHARRAQVAGGYRAGHAFMDHYLPALVEAPLYHVDGQQRDEVFVWGSWLQSKMHRAGVTCADCHDPHSQKLRVSGNAACAQCHDATKYDASSHHHHASDSPGAQCAECHMPRTTYMVIDARRDHSMRIPRPDQSVTLGVPNACNDCHRERDAKWAATQVRAWFGRDGRGSENFATAFRDGDVGDVRAAGALLDTVGQPGEPAIVRASALEHLGRLGVGAPEAVLASAALDREPLVRLAAVHLAEAVPPQARGPLVPLLSDPVRAVRIEAARVLVSLHAGLPPDAWRRASDEYVASLRYDADRAESRVALGDFYERLGQPEQADAAFAAARRLDPRFEPAYVNAADVLRARGRDADALALLEQGLQQVPDGASLHHALGLAQVRMQQPARALTSLRRATTLAPDVARYAYVYAVALHSAGDTRAAIALLERGTKRWPNDRDTWFALASFQADAGQRAAARRTATHLLERFPDDPQARELLARLQ